ncbi:MAG TPA: VOC family protein [Streptomyces sp.]|nr:VOC family protein [Streptomyces sp.]
MTEPVTRCTPGAPCWVSLLVHGLEASQEFYHELFGWEYRTGAGATGPYSRAVLDGCEVAGIGQVPPRRQLPVAWLPYLATDDTDSTAELVRMCGGTVGVGPLEVEGTARVAVASDPSGAAFGIRQSDAYTGAHPGGGPGTVVWNELITHQASTVEKFYRTVFGLDAEPATENRSGSAEGSGDGEEFDHITLKANGRAVGGVHGVGTALPRDRGAHWLMYVEVADTDAAARRVSELGGRVLRPPYDSPHGRVARVADREGAPFAVIRPATG